MLKAHAAGVRQRSGLWLRRNRRRSNINGQPGVDLLRVNGAFQNCSIQLVTDALIGLKRELPGPPVDPATVLPL